MNYGTVDVVVDELQAVFGYVQHGHGYVRIRCPYHANGQERHPSMSILTQPKNGRSEGFCKCFTCGWVGNVETLFKDAGYSYKKTATAFQSQPKRIVLTYTPPKTKKEMQYKFSPYLAKRYISSSTQEKFKTYEEGGKVNMPVFDRKGNYLFKVARSTENKMYFIDENAQKTPACIEEIDFGQPIYVVESQINAMSLYELGLQAVATLGAASLYPLKEALRMAPHIILAFDPDEAGRLATERCLEMFGAHRARYLELPEGKDINDILCDMLEYGCTKQEVIDFLRSRERFVYIGRYEI